MRSVVKIFLIVLFITSLSLEGCIHDYPHGTGKIPATSYIDMEITYNLIWDRRNHFIDLQTKAQSERPHHFVMEAMKDGKVVCRDELSLSETEFSFGKFTHTFSKALSNDVHQFAVWYEMEDENGKRSFAYDDLKGIHLQTTSIKNSEFMNSGFVNRTLDINDYITSGESIQMNLQHAGARFEIVSTDVQQFISEHKNALNQGDTFNLQVIISDTAPTSLNAYESTTFFNGNSQILSGDLFFPFAEYEELKIAEGFVFSNDESYLTMKIIVYNGAKAIVTQTPLFSFPVKTGRITTVRADFLSFPIDGSLGVDNIWDGDIEIDLDND